MVNRARSMALLMLHLSHISSTPTSYIASCAWTDAACARKALLLDGSVALRTPGLSAARNAALPAAIACINSGKVTADDLSEVRLPDGTMRMTVGTRTINGAAEPLPAECPALADATAAMRALVDGATHQLLRALQPLQAHPAALLATKDGSYATLAAVAHAGEQLEHFHAYHMRDEDAPTAPAADDTHDPHTAPSLPAVPLHTDAGLFIAIVPAMHLRVDHAQPGRPSSYTPTPPPRDADGGRHDGFYVQQWDGTRARVAPEDEAAAVIFVIGDGWAQWLNPRLTSPLRPAPHAMAMATAGGGGDMAAGGAPVMARVWYGRMYLPPADAVQHRGGQPFSQWRSHHSSHPTDYHSSSGSANTTAALVEGGSRRADDSPPLPAGCGGGRRYLQTSNIHGCLQNQIFCWHSCVAVDDLPCGTAAVCLRTSDATIWTSDDAHCTSCEATCLAPPSPPASPPNPNPLPPYPPYVEPFCTGPGTDMHMSGFAFHSVRPHASPHPPPPAYFRSLFVSRQTDCIILLFRDWKLDTPLAFALGVLGTFGLGILTEYLTWARRHRLSTSPWLRARPGAYRLCLGTAFTVQVSLGCLRTPSHTFSCLLMPSHTFTCLQCLHMPSHTFSCLLTPSHTFPHLLMPSHTFSHLPGDPRLPPHARGNDIPRRALHCCHRGTRRRPCRT